MVDLNKEYHYDFMCKDESGTVFIVELQRYQDDYWFKRCVSYACRADGLAEGRAEGRAEGLAEGRTEVAKRMLEAGMDIELICKLTGLDSTDIEAMS